MDIQVEGHNNRVAGRDYLELNAQLSLTPEQLQVLAVKPCPSCEVRLVTAQAQTCNHCLRERVANDQKVKVGVVIFLVFMVWGWLLIERGPNVELWQLMETLVAAGGIVLCGALLLEMFKLWWVCYSAEFFSTVWRALVRLVNGDRK
ncbi:TPA: hypothetical protein L3577_006400 [Pseudomonas aeruginosa]|uniref:hypothetical protein n=1 Tax=Pseudomonas aeruginosa TaxID=287 RepID=UPI001EF450DF|nr:hypothetical protein [Pseudomonas aeruginosa]MCV0312176.1 hypothetical protein [Pseudomonas aeruginosa]MDV7805161.1 hypothetical protein [Pseudomonas aeruginosa]CAB5715861.1 Uncharacterised protein [Pseudomonas aeruginosa]HBN7589176.1 hypothetical protein [Pseudomonas aeruginosa]HBO2690385.1 hypothetical protein [Pseudomonas aeruginosa]